MLVPLHLSPLRPVRLVRVTEPAVEPVTLDEAKAWLKITGTDDDAIVTGLIKAARGMFEAHTGLALIDTAYRAEWDALPRVGSYVGALISRELELPRSPLKASSPITAVTYLDSAGAVQTFASGNYVVDGARDPSRYARLWLKDTADWPDLGEFPGALRVEFTAGYGSAASAVPEEIKVCLKLLVAHLYEQRAPVNVGNIVNELPWSLRHLVEMHTIRSLA
jgi:uncharacterized phiE125 gp8 family phage protein